MYLFLTLPLFLYMAYKDFQNKREIPEWSIALSWLVYAITMLTADFSQIIVLMVVPIAGLGVFWTFHVLVEEAYHMKIMPRKWLLCVRMDRADVFVFPLMLPIMLLFGLGIGMLWLVVAYATAAVWFNDLKQGNPHRKNEIPMLTFATISMLFCILLALMFGGALLIK